METITGSEARRQFVADVDEIRSSYGYLLMRLAVAKDNDDTYAVCKKEFTEHEAAFHRLEKLLSVPGLSNYEARAELEAVLSAEPRQQDDYAEEHWLKHTLLAKGSSGLEDDEPTATGKAIQRIIGACSNPLPELLKFIREATEPRPPATWTADEIADIKRRGSERARRMGVPEPRPPAAAVDPDLLSDVIGFLKHVEWSDTTSETDASNLIERLRAALAAP